jgi:hypothetical protein
MLPKRATGSPLRRSPKVGEAFSDSRPRWPSCRSASRPSAKTCGGLGESGESFSLGGGDLPTRGEEELLAGVCNSGGQWRASGHRQNSDGLLVANSAHHGAASWEQPSARRRGDRRLLAARSCRAPATEASGLEHHACWGMVMSIPESRAAHVIVSKPGSNKSRFPSAAYHHLLGLHMSVAGPCSPARQAPCWSPTDKGRWPSLMRWVA